MIGSLLFYVHYPLSRYLRSRLSGASKKDPPPAVVNGRAVWDGGVVATKKFTRSQRILLYQWGGLGSGAKSETKERKTDPSPEKEDLDKEPLMAALHEETKSAETSEVRPAVKESEADARNGPQQDKLEAPKQEDILKITFQKTEDGNNFPTEELMPQLECLQTEDSTQETTYQGEIPSLEDSLTPAEPSPQETISLVEKQKQIPSMEESVMNAAHTTAEVTECWDEYEALGADVMPGGESSVLFASLLSDTETDEHDAQTGWHFPAGPGLTEELQCPLWQFPAVSYYPPTEPMAPFEVTWRVWEEMDESASAAEPALMPLPVTKATMDFTVMSYNILAQDLLEANKELYTHCPLEVLDWTYRCSLLLEEIFHWAPDILCLQEVQENHYHEQLYPVLSQMGYTCVYKRRTGTKTDGCATCYRSSCFSELSVTPLEFFRSETELLDRHNVGIVLLLQPVVTRGSEVKAKGPPLCVANTHLLFNPRRGDVKLAQLAIILAELDSMVKSCNAKGEHCNLILCGDFNSVPLMPLYQLITTGELYFRGLPAFMISGQVDLSHKAYFHRLYDPLWPSCLGITDNCQYTTVKEKSESQRHKSGKCQYSHDYLMKLRFCPAACVRPLDLELIPGVTDITPDVSSGNQACDKSFRHTIRHRLDLESVYKHILPGSGNPEVTTLHSEVGATVDYIFYSPRRVHFTADHAGGDFENEGLKLIGSLSLLSEDALWSMRGLPNDVFPSDHLSLLAKFQLDLNAA